MPDDIARATKIIHLVVTHGSPKEVILALSGALQGIEGRALGVDVGDDEDAENVELAESEELVDQLRLVIDSYTEGKSQFQTIRLPGSNRVFFDRELTQY